MQIPAARIYNLPTARMYSLSGQPFGRRSDSPPDDVADSPSRGPWKLERRLGQPFRRTLEQPLGQRPKLQPLYGVAHIRCQLSGRASPSRTSSCRNPDSLTALPNSFRGRERRSQIMHGMCMRARDEVWAAHSSSIYRKAKG